MVCEHLQKIFFRSKYRKYKRLGAVHLNVMSYHSSGESQDEVLPFEWYEEVFPKITKLSHQLRHVDLIDGQLVNVSDVSVIVNDRVKSKMNTLKSLVRVFIGSPSTQQMMKENAGVSSAGVKCNTVATFDKPSERQPMTVDSLTKVSNFLNVSAQRRKVVRHTICPQVTQHRIWAGALKEILYGLRSELDCLSYEISEKGSNMEQQIITSCLKFLADTEISGDPDSTSWMRPAPAKSPDSAVSGTWEDVLDMFNDLIGCLQNERDSLYHLGKLVVMKEGLSQIKDVLINKDIGYRESRHQESLVQKKLSKTLGHSSRCLFTLLLYYLYGYIRDIEVDVCGGIGSIDGENKFCLSMGRILTSGEDDMVWRGVKQLDRALGLFKFVWETAEMKGVLELHGHLWCVGAKDRTITYKRNLFFVHGIIL